MNHQLGGVLSGLAAFAAWGFLPVGETFSRVQWIAVLFALSGVVYSLIAYGALPLFALTLAISFAFYRYSRKKIQAAPIPGLFIETSALLVPALSYIVFKLISDDSYFIKNLELTLWMIGAGLVTSLPLLWFAAAAKKLNLSTSQNPGSVFSIFKSSTLVPPARSNKINDVKACEYVQP